MAKPQTGKGNASTAPFSLGVKKVTHNELSQRLHKLGKEIVKRPIKTKKHSVKPKAGYKEGGVRRLLSDKESLKNKAKFGRVFREIHSAQDELVSTASIRELMRGATEAGNISTQKLAEMEHVFELLSRVRFPTRMTGYALAGEVMQHPTSPGTGLFSSKGTMKVHNERDLERRRVVVEAMEDSARQKKASAEEIMTTGLRTAIAYSLNNMVAPVTAADVKPFALGISGKSEKDLLEQGRLREELKAIYVRMGGKQGSGSKSWNRKWAPRQGRFRSVSPRRG